MKRRRALFCLAALLTLTEATFGQAYDTLRVMTYNVLNYGFPATGSCPALLTESKHIWLRTVLQYTNPDILGLEKMSASPASFTTDTVTQKVLDVICPGCYDHTPFTNVSGYTKENLLYFKTQKLGWVSTTTIYSGDSNISDINMHTLFYKSPGIAATHDTIFLHVILVHLASGSGSASERANEITGAMTWLNSHVTTQGNYIFMGDFNTQSSSESCFQQITNSSDSNTLFFDPVGQEGSWDANPSAFARYLTQSTRTSDPGDCSALGGLDDRFDHILITKHLIDGTDSLRYIDSTFNVIGQDGLHVNKSLIAQPANTSVPDSVLNALYYMSEHLPVMLHLAVGRTQLRPTGAQPLVHGPANDWQFNSLVTDNLQLRYQGQAFFAPGTFHAGIYNMEGQCVTGGLINTVSGNIFSTHGLSEGVYLLQITENGIPVYNTRLIKVGH